MGVYGMVSGGQTMQAYLLPSSDTTAANHRQLAHLDALHGQLAGEEPHAAQFYNALPSDKEGVFRVSVVHERNSYDKTDNCFFDQYTLRELNGTGPYAGKYKETNAAAPMMRMPQSIHDGRMWGIWGKIIMFIATLTGASMTITGFIIWYRRQRRKG